jgi:ribosomal protein S18 acetylase RimI-like enzyme
MTTAAPVATSISIAGCGTTSRSTSARNPLLKPVHVPSTSMEISIRALTAADVDEALTLRSTAGWNQRHDDWRMLLQIAARSSFAAVAEGRIVGTAIGIDYGGFAWIAMMLVNPQYRGRGVGGRLLEAAIEAVPHHLDIRLDATPLGRPLYERYGFEEEARLTRYVADAPLDRGVDGRVRRLAMADLDAIVDHDRRIFGGDRRVVLAWALKSGPEYAYVADERKTSYCFGRAGRLFDQIGPVVAPDDERAQALVQAALGAVGARPVAIDAFDAHRPFAAWLAASGFTAQRPLFRMRLSRSTERAVTGGEVAILGPEFA